MRTAALLLALAALALAAAWRAGDRALPPLAAAALAVGAASACAERAAYDRTALRAFVEARDADAAPVRLTGRAAADGIVRGGRTTVLLDVETVEADGALRAVRGRARVDVGGETRVPEIREGRRVALWAQLRLPRASGTPGAFDAAAESRQKGVHALGYCKSAQLLEPGADPGGSGLRAAAARVRSRARRALVAHVLPGPEQALVRAMVLGDQQAVDDDTADAFRAAGTYHVLAISGAQVALLASLLSWALARAGLPPRARRRWCCRSPSCSMPSSWAANVPGRPRDRDGGRPPRRPRARPRGRRGEPAGARRPAAARAPPVVRRRRGFPALLRRHPRHRPAHPADRRRAGPGCRCGWRWRSRRRSRPTSRCCPLLAVHFHRVVAGGAAPEPGGGAALGGGARRGPPGAAPGGTRAGPRVRGWGDLAWMAAHALLRSALAVRAFPWLDVRVPAPPAWAVALFVAALAPLRGRTLPARVAAHRGRRCGPPLRRAAARRTAACTSRWSTSGRATRSCCSRRAAARGWSTPAARSTSGFDVGEAVVAPYLWSRGVRSPRPRAGHARPPRPRGRRARAAARLRGGRGLGGAGAAEGQGLRAARRGAARRRASRAGPSGPGTREDWDGVSIEVLGPRASGRRRGSRATTTRWCCRCATAQVTVLLAGDVEARGEALLPPAAGARAEGPAPRQQVEQQPALPGRAWARAWPSSPPASATASAIRIRTCSPATGTRALSSCAPIATAA